MKYLLSAPALVAMLLVASAPSHAATLLSENFNELTPALAVTSAGAFATLSGTNVDVVGGGLFGGLCAAPESGNCVDLGGSGGNPQAILQTTSGIALSPGNDYYLSFDLIGSGRGVTDSTTVTFAGYNQTFTLTSSDVTSGIVSNALITVTTPGTYYLTFTNNTPGNVGSLLDNVLVTSAPVTTGTPEPATFFLALPALLAGYSARRFVIARRR